MVSYATLGIIILVILSFWLSGKDSHRSLFQNSILSTSVLAAVFFLFISLGLYYGLKLKDNIGSILNHEKVKTISDKMPLIDGFEFDSIDISEGIAGVIFSIIFWFLFSIIITFLLYCLGIFFWVAVLLFVAMLYWIYFRALRLVFKNSGKCKGNALKSLAFGFFYSFLYISWIYGIIFLVNYIN